MELSEALACLLSELSSLSDVVEPDVILNCLNSNGVATLRKHKLTMDTMIWAVIDMSLFRTESVHQLINKLDIIPAQDVDFVERSALTQVSIKLDSDVVRNVFHQSANTWHARALVRVKRVRR